MQNLTNTIATTFLTIIGTFTASAICYTVYIIADLYC